MKRQILVSNLIWCLAGIGPLHAENIDGNQTDRYATIADGRWLNQKCNFLKIELRREFEWHLAEITKKIHKKLDSASVQKVQSTARKVAEQRKCDDEQNSIVVGTLDYARKLSLQITGATYNVDKYYKYRSDNFRRISTALGLEEMCKFTTQLARQRLLSFTIWLQRNRAEGNKAS